MDSKEAIEKLESILRIIGLKRNEIRIYKLLVEKRKGMRIREIQKELGISERSVREHVLSLYRKGLLERELIQRGWLGYIYVPVPPGELLKRIKMSIIQKIEELEKEFEE
ncbi:transcriptional regulator [Thermococci archaeon]|nr:MAG: transcriptional regulator [Thermococci archaeon]